MMRAEGTYKQQVCRLRIPILVSRSIGGFRSSLACLRPFCAERQRYLWIDLIVSPRPDLPYDADSRSWRTKRSRNARYRSRCVLRFSIWTSIVALAYRIRPVRTDNFIRLTCFSCSSATLLQCSPIVLIPRSTPWHNEQQVPPGTHI